MYFWEFIIWKDESLNQTTFCATCSTYAKKKLHAFLISALDKGELSALSSSRFNLEERSPFTCSIGDKMYPRFSVQV